LSTSTLFPTRRSSDLDCLFHAISGSSPSVFCLTGYHKPRTIAKTGSSARPRTRMAHRVTAVRIWRWLLPTTIHFVKAIQGNSQRSEEHTSELQSPYDL